MNAKRTFLQHALLSNTVAAAMAAFVAASLLAAVAHLFQRDGMPTGPFVAADYACAGNGHDPKHGTCASKWISASGAAGVSGR